MTGDNGPRVMNADELTRQFLKHQQVLLAYIRTLVADRDQAEDVLQETAVTLIRRAQDFGPVHSFWALAREVARRQALASLQKESRSGHLLPADLIEAIDAEFARVSKQEHWGRTHLQKCLQKLPHLWQRMIRLRYWMHQSQSQIAKELGRSTKTVSVTLTRARARLADCISRQQAVGETL